MCLTYLQANRLLFGLYKQETEIHRRKDDVNIKKQTDINHHGLKPSLKTSQLTDPPQFSLVTIFKETINVC
jgi:hypothetical protein